MNKETPQAHETAYARTMLDFWKSSPFLLIFLALSAGITLGSSRSALLWAAFTPCWLIILWKMQMPVRIILSLFLILGVIRRLTDSGTVFERELHSRFPAAAICVVRITDAFSGCRTIREYQPDNMKVKGQILKCRLLFGQRNLAVLTGKETVLSLPFREKDKLKHFRHGELLVCRGVWRNLSGPESPDYYYSLYLKSTGIAGQFKILNWKKIQTAEGFFQKAGAAIRRLREKTAVRLLRAMRPLSEESRMLLALALGYGNVLDRQTRNDFILSGTIHIFAISGLHVGLFFTMIYLFLQRCGCSPSFRRLTAGLLTACYVMLTGITPSSVRALGMALLLLYAQFRNRPPLPLNALGQIGTLSLLQNPHLLKNIGFLFSYTIVFFLLCSIPFMQHIQNILREKRKWLPPGTACSDRSTALICSLLSCLTAWFSGLGITMHMNGVFCVFSPLVNFHLLPLIPVCLVLIPVKILFSYIWSGGEIYCAAILSFIFKCMRMTAEWGGQLPGTILSGSQPSESILLFYIGCVILLFVHPDSAVAFLLCRWKERSACRPESEE